MDSKVVVGTRVSWRWLGGAPTGTVVEVVPAKTRIVSKGSLITRNGTPDNPAIIIQQQNGTLVLKLLSELHIILS